MNEKTIKNRSKKISLSPALKMIRLAGQSYPLKNTIKSPKNNQSDQKILKIKSIKYTEFNSKKINIQKSQKNFNLFKKAKSAEIEDSFFEKGFSQFYLKEKMHGNENNKFKRQKSLTNCSTQKIKSDNFLKTNIKKPEKIISECSLVKNEFKKIDKSVNQKCLKKGISQKPKHAKTRSLISFLFSKKNPNFKNSITENQMENFSRADFAFDFQKKKKTSVSANHLKVEGPVIERLECFDEPKFSNIVDSQKSPNQLYGFKNIFKKTKLPNKNNSLLNSKRKIELAVFGKNNLSAEKKIKNCSKKIQDYFFNFIKKKKPDSQKKEKKPVKSMFEAGKFNSQNNDFPIFHCLKNAANHFSFKKNQAHEISKVQKESEFHKKENHEKLSKDKLVSKILKNKEKKEQSLKSIHPSLLKEFKILKTIEQPIIKWESEKMISKFRLIFKNLSKEIESEENRKLKKMIFESQVGLNAIVSTSLQFYEVIKLIGEGSFGKVFLGIQKLTNRLVAIKRLEKSTFQNELARKKIMNEMNIQKALFGHSNIIKLLETFENNEFVYFVMEYASNGDLLKHLRVLGKFREADAKYVFFQVAVGVRYIHRLGFIHRDIKLDNVLIDEFGHYKICDFGVGRSMAHGELVQEHCGTPAYLAPEIILEKGYRGFAADIWSLGVLLFFMLVGHMPFQAATIEKLNKLIVAGGYSCPDELCLSEQAKDLLARMMTTDASSRITAEQLLVHPWMSSINLESATLKNAKQSEKIKEEQTESEFVINFEVLCVLGRLGFDCDSLKKSLLENQMNHGTACYFTLEKDYS